MISTPHADPRLERGKWRAQYRIEKREADYDALVREHGRELGESLFFAVPPYEVVEREGNLVTGAGVNNLWSGLCTAGLATPFNTTNAQIAVGDSATAAKPGDADLGAAAGSTQNTGDVSAATNATPIVLTVPSWTVQPIAGQVVVVAGVLGNTAANGTFEVSTSTATTLTLLNSAGNGAFATSAGSTVKIINKYRQGCSAVNVNPAVGSGITNVSAGSNPTVTTSVAHGLAADQLVTIASVGGATGANGTWSVTTVPTTTTFTITTGAPGSYTSGGTVNLVGGVQFVATFGTTNGNYIWNEWAISTGGGVTNKQAVPPPVLLNHSVPASLGTKTNAASWSATMVLSVA